MVKKPYVVSKNIKGSTELTLIAKIKPGFVGLPDPMNHGTRLKRLLGNLFELRKRGVETGRSEYVGPLERLRGIHFVRWSIFDEGRRLLLAVSFDRPWAPYIRRIVDDAGPLLDVIFMHCEGYEGHTSVDGYERFAEWVRAAQAECDFYFAAAPGLTTDDVRYLKTVRSELERLELERGTALAISDQEKAIGAVLAVPVADPEPPLPGPYELAELYRTAVGLYRLRNLFPVGAGGLHSDRATFDRACRAIVLGIVRTKDGARLAFPKVLDQQYGGIGAWYDGLLEPPPPIDPPAAELAADTVVQGGIIADPAKELLTHGAVVLLRFGADPSRLLEFLARVTASTSTTAIRYNVGLTPEGLKALGLTRGELAAFPMEFLQGMEERAGVLGDVGRNHPSNWRRPKLFVDLAATEEIVPLGTVEAVVLLQGSYDSDPGEDHDWSKQHPLFEAVGELETLGGRVLSIEPLRRDPRRVKAGKYREHFGYLDGFSQPSLAKDAPAQHAVSLGEILLGHANDRGEVLGNGELFRNGTYLVVRKLGQNVKAFEDFTRGRQGLAAQLMGREADGASLTQPRPERENDFTYEDDKEGKGCPLQSHVRLANPRTEDERSVHGLKVRVPRIMRRGFSYGPAYDGSNEHAPRGLMFLAYNASIADQYEIIQRWLNGANATGLDGTQRDPITGAVDQEGGKVFRYFEDGARRTQALPQFVTLEWGMYLFVPAPAALLGLVARVRAPARPARCPAHVSGSAAADARGDYAAVVQAGTAILEKLTAQGPDAPEPWLGTLEEQGARERAFATLTAIREKHGVLRTPIGVLVTSADAALTVLKDERTYSVREYYRRMRDSDMVMHLGMDSEPLATAVCPLKAAPGLFKDQSYVDAVKAGQIAYARESLANAYLGRIGRAEAFVMALAITRQAVLGSLKVALSTQQHIGQVLGERPKSSMPGFRVTSDLAVLAERVISALSQSWFGLPDGERMRHGGQPSAADDPVAYCPADFTYFSQYVFRPFPDATAVALAKRRGPVVTKTTRAFVEDQLAKAPADRVRFFKELAADGAEADVELLTRSLAGAVDGFVAANFGSFLSTVGQWLDSEDFWRIQQELSDTLARLKSEAVAVAAGASADALAAALADDSALLSPVVCALSKAPKPSWVHRTALEATNLAGVAIAPGDLLVVHVGQCAVEGGADLLFGRSGRADGPLHGCPAKEMAMGVLAGMLTGVLSLKNVSMDGQFLISFEIPPDLADQAAVIWASTNSL